MTSRSVSISENDTLRSEHMRRLLLASPRRRSAHAEIAIPRVLMQYWHDRSDVPPDVAECLSSWSPFISRGFQRLIFDDDTAAAFISERFSRRYRQAFDHCRHPAMRCDYFRLCWMLREGGFYVDADEWYHGTECDELFDDGRFKVQPLCYDVQSQSMVSASQFLTKSRPGGDRIYYVNNNPLIAPPAHPIVRLALERATHLLHAATAPRDIQSITGPGNLTACVVRHVVERGTHQAVDFAFIRDWDLISTSRWPLSYRNDERNWRLWNPDN